MNEWRIDPEDWPRALAETDGPQIVVAGPGTGKTEFLVRRVVELIDGRGMSADSLAILTFSRRAAADLKQRILRRLDRSTTEVSTSTFHSLAFRLLEKHGSALFGWSEMPSLLTGPEQVGLVASLLEDEEPELWPVLFRPLLKSVTFAEEVADFIMRSREYLLDPDDLSLLAEGRDDWRALPDFVARYTDELSRRGRLDYGTLQSHAVDLLDNDDVLEAVSEQFRYVIVDEYQDTTAAQSQMLARITSRHRNLTVAADPYQSVYSFRGAELHNVAEFPTQFRDIQGDQAQRLVLTTSFRVPAEILSAAVRLTAGGQLPGATGVVIPAKHAGRVEVRRFRQQSEEAEWIASEVQRLNVEQQLPLRHMAVLVRSKRRFLPELSRALERRSIPHDLPDARLVDHPAIRTIFDLVQASNPNDSSNRLELDRAVRRILLGPLLGIPLSIERSAYRNRLRTGRDWPSIIRSEVPDGEALAELLEVSTWTKEGSAARGFWTLWNSLPQFATLVHDPDRVEFRAAWAAFAQVLGRQEDRDPDLSLADYVALADREDFEATPLLRYAGDSRDRLTLTTLHQSKGLSFEIVFIADAVEGVMPDLRRQRSILQTRRLSPHHDPDPHATRRFRLQEEMRLAYTAMTRAAKSVVWTATDAGSDDPQRRPSRFLGALGVPTVDSVESDGTKLDSSDGLPVTPAEAESHLRRLLTDPAAPPSRRLAAATTLVERPNAAMRSIDEFASIRVRGPNTGLMPESITLSPSQSETYSTCPRQYVISRRLDAAGESGPYASFGRLIHDVLEDTEKEAVRRGQTHGSLGDALAHLDHRFPTADFSPHGSREAWKLKATRFLEGLYSNWIRPGAVPVLLERNLVALIDGIPWRGRADRIERTIDGQLRVVDYKTSGSAKTAAEASVSIQLAFYLLAAREDETILSFGEPTEAEYWFPASKRKQKWSALDPQRLNEVVEIMAATGRGISQEDWTPNVGGHCTRCPVRIACPEWPEGRDSFIR